MHKKLKTMQDTLLRGGFCAIWLVGFVLTVEEFIAAAIADQGSAEQTQCGINMLAAFGVFLVAVFCHAYLLNKKKKENEQEPS